MITDLKIIKSEVLSDHWYVLSKVTYEYYKKDKEQITQAREVYNRGNGAAILLYNKHQRTVILTRQFRLPAFVNGEDGMLVEVCAGQLDKDDPEACIRREAIEEVGYKVKEVRKVFEAYMSPGAVTEILYFFIAEYDASMKVNEGGGVEEEEENIEVLEMSFTAAYNMIASGGNTRRQNHYAAAICADQ